MVGDKEISNNCRDRLPEMPDTLESSSTKIEPESVRRCSKIIPKVKRMLQPLINCEQRLLQPETIQ